MCGFLYCSAEKVMSYDNVYAALKKQDWRGPDAIGLQQPVPNIFMGHVRLSIQDLSQQADQPMISSCSRYTIIFNGEIYNHHIIRNDLELNCRTNSDTETILEGFAKIGSDIFDMLEGMFSVVIYDKSKDDTWVARDRFGIKPLYSCDISGIQIYSSETISIRHLVSCTISQESVKEWELIRRPIPGKTFFSEIDEVIPGSVLKNKKLVHSLRIDSLDSSVIDFSDENIFRTLSRSIQAHELSDVTNVSLLSGGIDSSVITALSSVEKVYTVGMNNNNEFDAARETARQLGKEIVEVCVTEQQLVDAWETLINLRGEPLSVPNEGLIYLVCKSMEVDEKVVLTGEGADELFFGYDKIFRKAVNSNNRMSIDDFFSSYAYSSVDKVPYRLLDYADTIKENKSDIDFVEDFFIKLHLPGLLRRMDGASMSAHKEARVPFVDNRLAHYVYHLDHRHKLSSTQSKLPLRKIAKKLALHGALQRKKIGFSSTMSQQKDKYVEYNNFRKINMDILGWS